MQPLLSPPDTRRFTIYLPERDRHGKPVPNMTDWLEKAMRLFCRECGGATYIQAHGMWDTGDRIIFERVNLIHTAVKFEKFWPKANLFREFALDFGRKTNQHSVLIEYDGNMVFLPVTTKQRHQVA